MLCWRERWIDETRERGEGDGDSEVGAESSDDIADVTLTKVKFLVWDAMGTEKFFGFEGGEERLERKGETWVIISVTA